MRQAKKEIKEHGILEGLLCTIAVGRLGTIGSDGSPVIKPLNFAYDQGKIYFHSAREGEKIEDIKRDPRVCFEVDLPIALVKSTGNPCRAAYLYRSVIAMGRARIIDDEAERIFGLRLLMKKYQPEGGYEPYPGDKLGITSVIRIDIERMTGKEDLGEGDIRDAVLSGLAKNAALPLVFTRK
ncbi:MAG TPA: pyridoxamine 5'-phosphate oxidase family protein [Nitrospirota bacterium]|nr:pyridoxamine 5'-phosphate oxidase family protein [Nitrospirota bacterium]